MKSSQRCLCINAAVRNHFLRLSGRVFFVYLFYSHLKMHIFLWGARFLWEKLQIDRWNLHRDVFVLRQRWEIISLGFQNEFFLFYSCLKNGLSAIWKRKFFLWRALFQLKKITHVDRRNLHRNIFVLRQRWEINKVPVTLIRYQSAGHLRQNKST